MAGDHVLGPRGLERALRRAMQRNCLFRERYGGLSIDPVTVLADPHRMEVLAGQLKTYTSLPIPAGPGPLAELLADVATMVSHASLTVNIPSASSAELERRTARIRADFALECAAVLAASRGYAISVNQIPLSDLSRALWVGIAIGWRRYFRNLWAPLARGNRGNLPGCCRRTTTGISAR